MPQDHPPEATNGTPLRDWRSRGRCRHAESEHVFDLAIARTGLLHHEAQSRGFDALTVPILNDLDLSYTPGSRWPLGTGLLPRAMRHTVSLARESTADDG